MDVALGEVVDVAVDDLPGAGYRWVVRSAPADIAVLEEDAEHQAPSLPSPVVGGPARRLIRLRADGVGSHRVVLALVRPWESPDTPPAQVKHVVVTVRG